MPDMEELEDLLRIKTENAKHNLLKILDLEEKCTSSAKPSFRIYRTYRLVLACSPMEVRYGGPNPMKLVHNDELQYFNGVRWMPVEVIEGPKPEGWE